MGMTSKPPTPDRSLRREMVVVAALTLLGGIIRVWSFSRVGLNHFDEGVYALAGLWSISPHGLGNLDPSLVPYAPPGFPILIGCAYLCLGVADASAIAVSAACGMLTVPVAAWLAWRTFGKGAGGATAALAAVSGAHVTFSRTALVDVPFLLVWLATIVLGQRFLERPGPVRAMALGLAVGISQLFKYNGFTSGVIVALSAGLWMVFHREARHAKSMARTWGWGLSAAAVAAACYWPWFQFVEAHGGYRALVAHHRGYLGGIGSWPGHLALQLAQARMLSGGPIWLACAGLAATFAALVSIGELDNRRVLTARGFLLAITAAFGCVLLMPEAVFVGVLVCLIFALASRMKFATPPVCLLGVGWALLAVLTPFYHPYARLWLPLQALTWVFVGGLFVSICSPRETGLCGMWFNGKGKNDWLPWLAVACVVGGALRVLPARSVWNPPGLGILDPSDSLRSASITVSNTIPRERIEVRVFGRPPLLFYLALAGRADLIRQPDVRRLLAPGSGRSWAVLDMALVRQASAAAEDLRALITPWTRVKDVPAWVNLPTLLDVDPSAATDRVVDDRASLVILHFRAAGGDR
jgi:dolichyl-phosphate-mannose-protein mannosyltransferase